jgi:hypothetical protein
MSIKSDKTFEEIVERLVAVSGIKSSIESASDKKRAARATSPPDSEPAVSDSDIVTGVPPIQADTPEDQT